MRVLFFLFLFITLGPAQILASRLDWTVKREIGEQTIWKSRKGHSLRATSQVKMGESVLKKMSAREKFVEGLARKKAEGLEWLGIKEWRAVSTDWSGDKLVIKGDYLDRKGERIYFEERHYFEKDRRIILLLTSAKEGELSSSEAQSYFEIARTWELGK